MSRKKSLLNTKDIAIIAMQVAALIVGGYFIVLTMGQFPLPGIKYVALAPYLTMVMFIIEARTNRPYSVFYVNLVFAGMMTLINLYMGLAIVIVGVLYVTEERLIKGCALKSEVLAVSYAVWTVGVSLMVSKYLIGTAVFQIITPLYILVLMGIAILAGGIGVYFAKLVLGRIGKR